MSYMGRQSSGRGNVLGNMSEGRWPGGIFPTSRQRTIHLYGSSGWRLKQRPSAKDKESVERRQRQFTDDSRHARPGIASAAGARRRPESWPYIDSRGGESKQSAEIRSARLQSD